jgi:hypothetical protein
MQTLADMTWQLAVAAKMYDIMWKNDFFPPDWRLYPEKFDDLEDEDKLTLCLAAEAAQ